MVSLKDRSPEQQIEKPVMFEGTPAYKKLVIIRSVIANKIIDRFAVYQGKLCLMCTSSVLLACIRYKAIAKPKLEVLQVPSSMNFERFEDVMAE